MGDDSRIKIHVICLYLDSIITVMDKIKVEEYIVTHRHFFSDEDLLYLRHYLENVDELTWKMILSTSLQDPNTVRVVSIFAGPIGIDRFMVGDILLGVLKTLTCGGLGIWAIVDCFIIYRITQKFNFRKILNQF